MKGAASQRTGGLHLTASGLTHSLTPKLFTFLQMWQQGTSAGIKQVQDSKTTAKQQKTCGTQSYQCHLEKKPLIVTGFKKTKTQI